MAERLQNQSFEKGIIGSCGTCVAHSYVFKKRIEVERRTITVEQIPEEIQRLDFAIKKTADDIQNFRKRAEERHGEKYAAIFDSHLLMLEDPQFRPKLISRIEKDKINVESAVRERIDEIHKQFSAIADPYLRERAIDIKDVGDRLLRHLLGLDEPAEEVDSKPYVLVAQEVTPSELLNFARGELRGICLDTGGATSHVAILSDALGIPVVGRDEDLLSGFLGNLAAEHVVGAEGGCRHAYMVVVALEKLDVLLHEAGEVDCVEVLDHFANGGCVRAFAPYEEAGPSFGAAVQRTCCLAHGRIGGRDAAYLRFECGYDER